MLGIVGDEPDGHVAGPMPKRIGLVLRLGLGKVQLENGGRPILARSRGDPGHVRVREHRTDPQAPPTGSLVSQLREAVQPCATFFRSAPRVP